jgi:hypothetical protein
MRKPSERAGIPDMIGDVEGSIALSRRGFFKGMGFAVLTVQFLPLIVHASGEAPGDGQGPADNLIVHLSPGFISHVHDLLIPYAVLRNPPVGGVELKTTEALFHRHPVKLTREQLMTVNRGGTVTGHASSHRFVIALTNRRHP